MAYFISYPRDTFTLVAPSATSVTTAQAFTSPDLTFVIDGAAASGGEWTVADVNGYPQKIVLTCSADDASQTVTVTGFYDLDRLLPFTITLAGTNIGTTVSDDYVAVITGATVDATTTGTMAIGTSDALVIDSPKKLDENTQYTTVVVDVSGTVNYDVQASISDTSHTLLDRIYFAEQANKTASLFTVLTGPRQWLRIKVNSFSSTPTIILEVSQNTPQ